jgi:hypothetical protein
MDVFYGSHLQRQVYGATLHKVIGREQNDESTQCGSKIGSLHFRCQSRSSIWSKVFQMKGLLWMKQSGTQSGLDK